MGNCVNVANVRPCERSAGKVRCKKHIFLCLLARMLTGRIYIFKYKHYRTF